MYLKLPLHRTDFHIWGNLGRGNPHLIPERIWYSTRLLIFLLCCLFSDQASGEEVSSADSNGEFYCVD